MKSYICGIFVGVAAMLGVLVVVLFVNMMQKPFAVSYDVKNDCFLLRSANGKSYPFVIDGVENGRPLFLAEGNYVKVEARIQ